MQLQESGELARLKMKWWREKRGGGACEGSDIPETPKLTFDHVKGIFVVLFFGCIVGIVLGVIRWLMNVKKISKILEVKKFKFKKLKLILKKNSRPPLWMSLSKRQNSSLNSRKTPNHPTHAKTLCIRSQICTRQEDRTRHQSQGQDRGTTAAAL